MIVPQKTLPTRNIQMRLHLLDWIMYAVITASLGVLVRLWIGKVEMRYDDIQQAEMMTYEGKNLRLGGYGGVKAAIGWFWNSKVGVYKAFVNRREESILITMKSGKKIALSSANPEEVIEAIQSNIN